MAINAGDRDKLLQAVLSAFGEDYQGVAKVIRYLVANFGTVAWMTSLRVQAAAWVPFQQSGLSITWWCDEVQRLSSG